MDPQVIDAQFDRAVQIVQSLPKNGPIQTGYEEKLAMYSLYKQATVGNVTGLRPGMWDMLARAKWDAWAKHKDLNPYEAKWQYVEELLRVLRKYSDKTVAQDLVRELEAFENDPSNPVITASYSKSQEDDSSDSEIELEREAHRRRISQSYQNIQQHQQQSIQDSDSEESDSEAEEGKDRLGTGLHGQPVSQNPNLNQSLLGRPQSSLSTQRYRTPLGSFVVSPPLATGGPSTSIHPSQSADMTRHHSQPQMYTQRQRSQSPFIPSHVQDLPHGYISPTMVVPPIQPMPGFETPSAFPGPSPGSTSSILPSTSGTSALGGSSFTNIVPPYPANMYPGHPEYHHSPSHHSNNNSPGQVTQGQGMSGSGSGISTTRTPLERAVENLQGHVTALQERMDILESRLMGGTPFASRSSLSGPVARRGSPHHSSPYGSYYPGLRGGTGPDDSYGYLRKSCWAWLTTSELDEEYFGWDHMGLWCVALKPLAKMTRFLARVVAFLISRRDGGTGGTKFLSPGLAILRRLLLDASFVVLLVYFGRKLWRRSGVRRREVVHALMGVWGAVVGKNVGISKQMVDRGV